MPGTTGNAEDLNGFAVLDMTWRMDFYHERRGIMARYTVEASLPAAAVLLGRSALLAEYPPTPRGRLSLFAQAQDVEGQDPSGWLLYRIVNEDTPASAAAPAPAT
jgi:hypothetical protein